MKFKPLILVAAYGRTYEDADAMREAWESGADMRVYPTSTYCSIRDMTALQRDYTCGTIINTSGKHYHIFGGR